MGDDSTANWSVYSEVYSSDLDNDEEFNIRLKEIDKGKRLKRKSTLVPDPVIKNVTFSSNKLIKENVISKETTTDVVVKYNDQNKLKRK